MCVCVCVYVCVHVHARGGKLGDDVEVITNFTQDHPWADLQCHQDIHGDEPEAV